MKTKLSQEEKIAQNNKEFNTSMQLSLFFFKKNQFKQRFLLFLNVHDIVISNKSEQNLKFDYRQIEAITISVKTSEFILHLKDQNDLRFSSYNQKEQIVLFLLKKLCKFDKQLGRFPIYFQDELSLQKFCRTKDLGELPNINTRVFMNAEEFFVKQKNEQNEKNKEIQNTEMLFTENKENKVTKEDFELLKVLGKGAHGKVLLCERKFGIKKLFAMKILKKQMIIQRNQLEHTKAEKMIMSHINHPFLTNLKYSFQAENKIYFVMEFMKGGELFQHLKKCKQFSEKQTKFIAACIVLALGHLHNKNYIYRDLKPENVLLDENGFAKLTDFGLAKFLKKNDQARTFCGTPEYLAPEVILDKGCNRPADWWALGILVYEMIYGIPPFYSTNIDKMYRRTILKKLKFKKYVDCSDECKDFLYQILQKKPEQRLGSIADSLEVMSHPWFKDFNWSQLIEKKSVAPYQPIKENWEDNFDPQTIRLKPSDSICHFDSKIIQKFKADFEMFDFNVYKEHDEDADDYSTTCANEHIKQIQKQDKIQQEVKNKNIVRNKAMSSIVTKEERKKIKEKLKNQLQKKKEKQKITSIFEQKKRSPFKFVNVTMGVEKPIDELQVQQFMQKEQLNSQIFKFFVIKQNQQTYELFYMLKLFQ